MTIRKVKLTKVFQSNKDREGNPLTGQFGPYYKIGLQTAEYPTKYINGFNKTELPWKAGDEVEIDIIEKGEYLNFKVPKKDDLAVAGVQELEERVKKLEDLLKTGLAQLKSDICLELTGKVQTTKDYHTYTGDLPGTLPVTKSADPFEGVDPSEETPF